MRNDQMSEAGVPVGVTPEAREMNCTDEEARILTRNVKRYISREDTLLWKIWKGLRWVGWALLINPAAGILFGTLGYFLFGVLFAINEGRMHFYAGYTFNTFPAFVISTILLWYSLKAADDDVRSPLLWNILTMPIFLLTTLSMYLIAIVTLPSLVLIGLAVFFGPSGGAFGLIGLLGLMLPLGYLWMLRRFGIIGES